MKLNKPISVRVFVKVRGTDAYRARTQAELDAAVEKVRARRDKKILNKVLSSGPASGTE
jgi:hypothetical protein